MIRFGFRIKGCAYFCYDVPFLLGTYSQLQFDHQSIFNSKMAPNFSKDDHLPNYDSFIRNEN